MNGTRPGDAAEHDWSLRRLSAHVAGLLSDAEAERLESHLDTCESCRTLLESHAALAPIAADDAAHVPAALIADWSRQQRVLRGMERATIRHHLERCASCRQDLVALGYEPVLAFDAALEPADLLAGALDSGTSEAGGAPDAERRITPIHRPRRLERMMAAWASVATAAAATLLFVVLRSPPRVPAPEPTPGGPTLASPGGGLFPGFERGITLVLVPGAPGSEDPVAFVPAGTNRLLLVLDVRRLDAPPGSDLTLTLSRDGRALVGQRLAASVANDSSATVVLRGSGAALGPGHYALEARAGDRSTMYAFRIAR